jgi:hypothetical protein
MKRMLVLGDSISWGQGLDEAHKSSALLARAWSAALGDELLDVVRFAHSGADIWDDGQSGVTAALDPAPPPFESIFFRSEGAIRETPPCGATQAARDARGEVPDETPYLLRQIVDAAAELGPEKKVDLVVLNAGINDTEIYNLIMPGKLREKVVARGTSLKARIEFTLSTLGAAFPGAKVLMTGYYPVVSEKTRVLELLQLWHRLAAAALEEGIIAVEKVLPFGSGLESASVNPSKEAQLEEFLFPDPLAALVADLAARCRDWTVAMHGVLTEAIAAFDAGRHVASFVDPAFGPEHAIFAPQSLLWPFVDGQPTDPLAAARKKYCQVRDIRGFDRLTIECASMGHPSVEGAQRYGDALIRAARGLQMF